MSSWVLRIEDNDTMTSALVGPYPSHADALTEFKRLDGKLRGLAFVQPMTPPGGVAQAVSQFIQETYVAAMPDG